MEKYLNTLLQQEHIRFDVISFLYHILIRQYKLIIRNIIVKTGDDLRAAVVKQSSRLDFTVAVIADMLLHFFSVGKWEGGHFYDRCRTPGFIWQAP
jgi:hypothetical protein